MNHREFIQSLGGGTKVAELLLTAPGGGEIDREAVYKWIKLNRVPWKWRPALVAVARGQGVSIPADFIPGVVTQPATKRRAIRTAAAE